jgi:hypothetical protein
MFQCYQEPFPQSMKSKTLKVYSFICPSLIVLVIVTPLLWYPAGEQAELSLYACMSTDHRRPVIICNENICLV